MAASWGRRSVRRSSSLALTKTVRSEATSMGTDFSVAQWSAQRSAQRHAQGRNRGRLNGHHGGSYDSSFFHCSTECQPFLAEFVDLPPPQIMERARPKFLPRNSGLGL